MEEVYEIIFSSPELVTVADYVADPRSPGSNYINREEEFLAVKNKEGKTNKQAILERFKFQGLQEKYSKLPAKQIPIKTGTIIAIPAKQIDKMTLLTQGIEVVSNDTIAFKAQALADLESKEGYNPIRKTWQTKGKLNVGVLSEAYPEVTVWVWCRALSDGENNDGEIFNITPFIEKITTNVGRSGGNFEFSLPPIACEIDSVTKQWIIKKASLNSYVQGSSNLTQQGDGYVAESSLLSEDSGGEIRRSQFLFHNILSSNDLVFIRFETLELEREQRIDDNKNFIIDKSQLPGRIYDMIGLIDSNTQVVSGLNTDVAINISGRDLSKLFIEDGTYFYPLEMSQGQLRFAGGSAENNAAMQRVFTDNALPYFKSYFDTSIENVLKFVIQQLSTIKVVPNDLFEHYKNRRNVKYSSDTTKPEIANGIWQIIKLVIDESITSRRIVDSSTSSASGSLLNFIRKVCQEPFVEFYMDTYGDMFHLIARKPPTDAAGVFSLLNSEVLVNTDNNGYETRKSVVIDIEIEDVLSEQLTYDDQGAISWYQLTPQNNFLGNGSTFSLAYLPAIFFQEYAEIWGSRPLQITHNYMPYLPLNMTKENGLDISTKQAFRDLKYLVESNAYLPFTRRGSITLNGDRRLKIGNVCRYKPTGEIFFIDNVQQTFQINDTSIDRTTTIEVSRGMVESVIRGQQLTDPITGKTSSKPASYFSIIDTDLIEDEKTITETITETIQVGTKLVAQKKATITTPQYVTNINMQALDSLPLASRERFRLLIDNINKSGYRVEITSAGRSYIKQALLHKQDNRNAKPGSSDHEVGKALDLNLMNLLNKRRYVKKTPRVDWENTGIPTLAKSLGFKWGGELFTNYYDPVHFAITSYQNTPQQEEEPIYETKTRTITRQQIDEAKVFSNFKVFKECFNYLLRRRQNDIKIINDPGQELKEVVIKRKKK